MGQGVLLVLLFTGQLTYMPFNYEPIDYTGDGAFDTEEIALSCSFRAEKLYLELAEHSWDDPRGQGWYLKDGSGTLQGHIC